MSKEIESPAPDAEQDALNEEQTVPTMEKAANSPRNDVASVARLQSLVMLRSASQISFVAASSEGK